MKKITKKINIRKEKKKIYKIIFMEIKSIKIRVFVM